MTDSSAELKGQRLRWKLLILKNLNVLFLVFPKSLKGSRTPSKTLLPIVFFVAFYQRAIC